MTNAFDTAPDNFIIAKVNENFAFITQQSEPMVKAKEKKKQMDKAIPFGELSFIHMAIFTNAFRVAKARGLLSAGEIAAGDEVMALIS